MAKEARVNVVNALRLTIDALEEDAEIDLEHPDLTALKAILVRRIADLERDDERELPDATVN